MAVIQEIHDSAASHRLKTLLLKFRIGEETRHVHQVRPFSISTIRASVATLEKYGVISLESGIFTPQ